MSEYCQPSDLYSYGLPRGGLANPYRLVESVSVAGNTLSLDQHSFALNDQLTFRAESGGSLPAPLVANTVYYAIPVDDSTFQVAASADGAAIDLTTAGENVGVVPPSPIPGAIRWASELINDMLPAHAVPLEAPYPPIITMTAAELAVQKILQLTGRGGDALREMVDAAQRRLLRWNRGIPLRGENVPTATNLTLSAGTGRGRGWGANGCLP